MKSPDYDSENDTFTQRFVAKAQRPHAIMGRSIVGAPRICSGSGYNSICWWSIRRFEQIKHHPCPLPHQDEQLEGAEGAKLVSHDSHDPMQVTVPVLAVVPRPRAGLGYKMTLAGIAEEEHPCCGLASSSSARAVVS